MSSCSWNSCLMGSPFMQVSVAADDERHVKKR
jgi:hypothetical protein